MIYLLVPWAILFILHAKYKLIYKYQTTGNQPQGYKFVSKALAYVEAFCLLIAVGVLTSVSSLYIALVPIVFLIHKYVIDFMCFKRESDKLYMLFKEQGSSSLQKNAFEHANWTINRQIEQRERI